jgi:pseudouridine kinase
VKLLVIGSSIVDFVVRPATPVLDGDSNEADIRPGAGGAARNVAEVLARLGADVTLVTDLGDDFLGRWLASELAALGVAMRIVTSARTGVYLAVLRADGSLGEGFCQTSTEHVALAQLEPHVTDLARFDGVVLDSNLSEDVLEALARRCRDRGVPFAVQTVASQRAKRAHGALAGATLVKPNRLEAEALTGLPIQTREQAVRAAEHLRALGAVHVMLSLGAEGILYHGPGQVSAHAAEDVELVDVTGAGDSLLGAAFLGLLRGLPIDDVLAAALRAAALACTSDRAVSVELSPAIFARAETE